MSRFHRPGWRSRPRARAGIAAGGAASPFAAVVIASAAAAATLLLAACTSGMDAGGAGSSGTASSGGGSAPALSAGTLAGVVHGGQSPIVGATVALWEAGPAGSPPTAPLQTTHTAGDGSYSFADVTDYGAAGACSSAGSLVYVVASGGNPGTGTNTAINLMAAAGACGSLPGYVVVNELTTVAAVYALNGFSYQSSGTAGTAGSLSGCVNCTPMTSNMTELNGNAPGISHAFATAANLVDVTTGNPAAWLPSASVCLGGGGPANCAAVGTLTALANSLAACVNSEDGADSTPCQELFACAVPSATFTSGTEGAPGACTPPGESTLTDTLAATLSIARNPGLVAAAGVYDVATQYLQFSPGVAAAPSDWAIALSTPFFSAWALAVDAQGDVWVEGLENPTITELGPTGATLATYSGRGYAESIAIDGSGNVWLAQASEGGITEIPAATGVPAQIDAGSFYGIAVDPAGHVWAADADGDTVAEIDASSGAVLSGAGFSGGGLVPGSDDAPFGMAIDAANDVWVTTPNYTQGDAAGALTEFNSVGTASADSPISGGGINFPEGIAIDPAGDVWVVDTGASSVTKLAPSGLTQVTQLWTSPSMEDGLEYPEGIAIDAAGTGWISGSGGLSALGSDGTLLTPNAALTGGEIDGANAVAVDASGDVWVTDSNGGLVTEFIGVAAPTVTPLVAQITPAP